ncbi:GTP pyrophosphokinase [Microbispora sp. CA-135349]|uniref:GTP pyrophosphokinase n=1 Tax=Microbispora sp. CA-135349 TaxID=3239953 RepID=UPI003D8A9D6F
MSSFESISPRSRYYELVEKLNPLGPIVVSLLQALALARNISVHSITYRIKEEVSARKKLSNGREKYAGVDDLTDLLGVRIITYFPNEVDAIAKIIEDEFRIDRENSVDKRKLLDPDRFGYLSLHYIAMLNEDRCKLIEYQPFADLKFEVQIRSILQHAWAEIEHDLGYKSQHGTPAEVRRRFSRLAGLLELADAEFQAINQELRDYEVAVVAGIDSNPEAFNLDQATISDLIRRNPIVAELDKRIARTFGEPISMDDEDTEADKYVAPLLRLGLLKVDEVTRTLEERSDFIARFVDAWLQRPSSTRGEDKNTISILPAGISLFYLCYVLACEASDPIAMSTLRDLRFTDSVRLLGELRAIYAEVQL